MTITHKIFRPFFNAYMYIFGSRMAAHKLRNLADNCGDDVGQLFDLAFSFEYKPSFLKFRVLTTTIYQVKSEIAELCRIVRELNPKVIVEVGTFEGATLFLFARVASPDKIISVDLPGGSFGGGYPFWKIPFFKSLGNKHVIQLIRADSHSEETRAKIQSRLLGSEVDFMFIDGDHTYQGVKQDFQMYSPLVRKGGIVAFHDIAPHDTTSGCEVDRFWNEIKSNYKHVEIIEKKNQKWAGIGVLYF